MPPQDNPQIDPKQREIEEQMPIDAYITKVKFDIGNSIDLLRIVVMNNQEAGTYAPLCEYHHNDTSLSVDDVSDFMLRCSTIAGTLTAIQGAVGSMPYQFKQAQVPVWSRGVYTPTAARARLFSAHDPDDSTRMIGVLIEQNTSGAVTQVTWYKTCEASGVFSTAPETLHFRLVTDSEENPSTDPNDIGGWTWYYSTNGPI